MSTFTAAYVHDAQKTHLDLDTVLNGDKSGRKLLEIHRIIIFAQKSHVNSWNPLFLKYNAQ